MTQVTQMPIPPMNYVKLYTDEAVKRGTAPKYVTANQPCQIKNSDQDHFQTPASDS